MVRTTVAVGCVLVALAGCGSTPAAKRWQDTDACTVLSDAEISAHLRGQEAKPAREDTRDRPTCVWRGNANDKVRMVLWQPPFPEVQTGNAKRTLDIGGKPGYVTSQTSLSCLVDVNAGTAWIQFDTHAPLPKDGPGPADGAECDRVVDLATAAIKKLGW
jgi:hypothetical protein